MEKYILVTLAPIPVGHRVQILWYEIVESGLFSTSRVMRPHEPIVIDQNTSVVYCSDRSFSRGNTKAPNEPFEVSEALAHGAQLARRVEGTVRACRVITIRTFSDIDVQTELTVELDA